MRLLLDECIPNRLKRDLSGHGMKTLHGMGRAGTRSGALLRPAEGPPDAKLP